MDIERPDLAAALRRAEAEHGLVSSVGLEEKRQAVVEAAGHYTVSRYRFGEALAAYKAAIPYAGWMNAVDAIARTIQKDERTIRNILADYKKVKKLAPEIVSAMESAGIDPATRKNAKVVEILQDADASVPAAAVSRALQIVKSASNAKKPPISQLPHGCVKPTAEETAVYKVRLAIRSALRNVAQNRKLDLLKQAIAEEVYALVGFTETFSVVPCEPTLDLMGMKRVNSPTSDSEVVA